MSQKQGDTQLQELLDQAVRGQYEAYDELIAQATQRLYKLARKMFGRYPNLRRWEQTDDVFQQAMIRLHGSLKEVQPDSVRAFFGLAATQIRRTLIDLARHHFGPEGQGAKHHTDGEAENGVCDRVQAPVDKPETLEEWSEFHRVIDGLPVEECEVFSLIWYGGMSQKDAASVLEVSDRTVRRRLHRARVLICKEMRGTPPAID